MKSISITRALQELKLLDQRINKELSTNFIETKKVKSDKVQNGLMTVEQFNEIAKSKFQSVNDLIERRKVIKSHIVKSNATTEVEIAGIKYTVADAIERKTSIEYDKKVLNTLKSQLSIATRTLENANLKLEQDTQNFINAMVGKDSTSKEIIESATKMAEAKTEGETTEYVDPLGIKEVIDKLENDIINFANEVDMVLSEINSITMIEIED